MTNLTITIDGECSINRLELAKHVAGLCMQLGFGTVINRDRPPADSCGKCLANESVEILLPYKEKCSDCGGPYFECECLVPEGRGYFPHRVTYKANAAEGRRRHEARV